MVAGGRRGSLRARLCHQEGKAVIAFMERAVLAVPSLPALEMVRPRSLYFAPSWVQGEGRAPGGIGLVEGGLELRVWLASVQARLHIFQFYLFIVQCLFVAAEARWWSTQETEVC